MSVQLVVALLAEVKPGVSRLRGTKPAQREDGRSYPPKALRTSFHQPVKYRGAR
jgi:hypothetical protein